MSENTVAAAPTPAGWYPDATGHLRWWDGYQWGQYAPPAQPTHPQPIAHMQYAGRTANNMPVSYTRKQTGHSITKHLLLGWIVLYIPTIYFAVSPNHYFHA